MFKKEETQSNAPSPATTERRQSKEALGKSEELYRTMIELSPDSIVAADMKGIILLCNAAATRLSGYSKDELIGKHFSKIGIIRLRDAPKYLRIFNSTLIGRPRKPLEISFYRKDGTIIWTDVRIDSLKLGGKVIVQSTIRDITERKRMEQELQKKNEQLDAQNEELRAIEEELRASNEELRATNEELRDAQEKLVRSERLAAIGQLAGGVGHELRNPLSAIKNAVYYVRVKVAKSELAQQEPRVMEFLDIIDEEINSSGKIINDLLGFSRVGKPTVSPARIEKVIEDVLSHTTIPENIELTKKLDTDLPEVKIDTDQARQVLVNMILNAVQAMPTGGKLTINAREKDKFLEVEIADTGCGIPQEVMDKIFDPLFTTRAKGTGLGLAVCKAIIDRHQGHIEVESEVGKKTTFTIKLPLEAE